MIVIGVAAVICLQIIVSEVSFLSGLLKTTSVLPLEMLLLFGVALIALFAVEVYKLIERRVARKKGRM